jgi:hypothetical protein
MMEMLRPFLSTGGAELSPYLMLPKLLLYFKCPVYSDCICEDVQVCSKPSSFEVVTIVLLKPECFWDVMMCLWVSGL